MAKNKKEKFNYKNVKINEEELSVTKIGEITTGNQSPLFIFVFVGILLVFIFFLPTIVNIVNGNGESPIKVLGGSTSNKDNKEDEPKENENNYYDFSNELSINLENNIVINDFSLNGNKISFSVENKGTSRFSFETSNYFLEIYTSDNTLLERIILNDIVVNRESTSKFFYDVSSNTASNMKKVTFVKKNVMDYPNVILEKNDNNEEILICSKNTEELTYKFLENKLITITDDFKYSNEFTDYLNVLNDWKTKTDNLNSIEGVTAMFVDTGNSFGANVLLDLKNVNTTNLNNTYYYKYQTDAKVVKFEMEARGFSCK